MIIAQERARQFGPLLLPGARTGLPPTRPVVAACVVAGGLSLLVAGALGYDAFAWMVWARELLHGELQTAGGPSFKALPVIVAAPLTPFGDLAPIAWLGLMRICALLSLLVAYRVGSRLGGIVAGVAAATLLAVGPDLYRTALFGSAEPLLVLLALLAAERYIVGSPRTAIVLLGVGGLIRPELWPIVLVLAGVVLVRERRLDVPVLAAAIVPPVVWLGLAWAGSGTALNQVIRAGGHRLCSGCAAVAPVAHAVALTASAHVPALDVLQRLTEAMVLPALALAAGAVVIARRRGMREPVVIALVAVAWILIVAAMAQWGYPGSRRYLAGPAALLAPLAGAGLALAVVPVRHSAGRVAIAAAISALVLIAAFPTIRSSARLVSTARAEQRAHSALRDAVRLAGGRGAVLAIGRPAVNPWMQTALAWDLDAPLSGVQATWNSRLAAPRWTPPAVVFRGPRHLAGPTPVVSPARRVVRLGRTRGWTVLRAE